MDWTLTKFEYLVGDELNDWLTETLLFMRLNSGLLSSVRTVDTGCACVRHERGKERGFLFANFSWTFMAFLLSKCSSK